MDTKRPRPRPWSRACGGRCFLSALVAFGVRGLILTTLAAKPIAFDRAGEPHAVRMKGRVTIVGDVAKKHEPLIVATIAQDAWARVARHFDTEANGACR